MDFSELRQMGEELISLGNQQVNENDDKNLDATNNNTEDVSFSNLQSSSPPHNNSSFTFPTSYRNVESSIASTSYSSAIDDPLASAVTHNQNTSQHTYFNASELLGINSLYKNQMGLGNAEFTSPSPVMEDIEEGDEGVTDKHFDDPVLHFHDPGRGVDNSKEHTSSSTSSVMKDSQVAQLLQQQLDGWNFQDDKQSSSDWNMNIHGLQELDTQHDFQHTFMNGNMLKQADQRENFDTSSLYFSTHGSDYAPSMDNLETQQFFPNPHQPLVSISGSGATTSVSTSAKVSTEKRFQPTKHRVARKELRSLPAKLAKAKKKKQQQQQQQQRMFQNQTTIPTTTTNTCTTSNILQMPNLSSGNISSITSTFTRPTSASVSSARSYSTQSTSQQSYNKTVSPPPPPILDFQNPTEQQELIQPSDMPETTRLIYAAFAQTKFVYYDSADDKRAKRSSVPDGFAGFACKHCEGKSKCAEGNNSSRKKPKFARCGRYFPSNIKTFADRSKTLNALVKHLGKCPLVPLQTRNNLILFEQSHDEETKMKRLLNANYTQKEIFKVMWNRLHPGDEE